MIGIKPAGHPVALLCLGIVAFSVTATNSAAAQKPSLPTPKCVIVGAKYIPASRRIVGQGSCSYTIVKSNGRPKKVASSGRKWSYMALKVYDHTEALCKVPAASAQRNTFVVQKGVDKVVVTFKLSVTKNRYHSASRAATKTVTKVLGGKTAACGNAPVILAPEGANSPHGSNNGYDTSDPSRGFNCGWIGGVTVDSSGIHIPAIDCSGNGSCKWVADGKVVRHGFVFYTGDVKCSNGLLAVPVFDLTFTHPDGTSCVLRWGETRTFPITPSSFTGTLNGTVSIQTFGANGMPLTLSWPTLGFGPIVGTGSTTVC